LHFFWMRAGKNNFAEVWVYTAVIAALLGWRVWHALRSRATASRGLMVS
jgi:sulfoxide reductase heme-binding subunit YedZ